MASFIQDLDQIRQRAMRKLEDGAVTDNYKLDREQSVAILNEALASEIVCVLRYLHHYFMASGVHGRSVAQTFKEHSDEEREHMDEIAERIQQLGGKPNFNPGTLVERSVSQYVEGESLGQMIREDLIAERIVIDVYQRFIEHFGTKDPTTRTMFEHIKAEEEDHADELSELLFIVDPRTGSDSKTDPWVAETAQSAGAQGESPEEYELVERVMAEHEQGAHAAGAAQQAAGAGQESFSSGQRLEASPDFPASAIGGVSGRPMNRRESPAERDDREAAESVHEGGMRGTNRSPKVLQKQRKNRVA
jgi:bacterioferritin